MKRILDINVLLAFVSECNGSHRIVRDWWSQLEKSEKLYIPRSVQTGLLRLLCTTAVMGEDVLSLPQAWSCYAQLLASQRFSFAVEPPGIDSKWERLCRPFKNSPKVVMDAYLAAFSSVGGYRLVTLDRAFHQFEPVPVEILG
jgi:toxin-antitoxin system PIN domain toxin